MKIGLVISTYNRPAYLSQCLESLVSADIPEGMQLVISDDASTDQHTLSLIRYFNLNGVQTIKSFWSENKSVRRSLEYGFSKCFEQGCDFVVNLDSDAVVKQRFLHVLAELAAKFPGHIITGFNCTIRNGDGSERHPIISRHEGYSLKKSVGGINMGVDRKAYDKYIKPALSKPSGNWDHMACQNAEKDGKPIVCAVPSVVQHIGFVSSMGHSGEQPDIAEDFKNLVLPTVTLLGVDCRDIGALIRAQQYSTKDIDFAAVKLLSSQANKSPFHVLIDPLQGIEGYSRFMIRDLYRYVDTDHVLIIQHDGYVLNWKAWEPEFLKYDYIGATWWYKDGHNVGNGGFSLRSRRLLQILATDETIRVFHPEDDVICRQHRDYLEREHGIKFAPEEVANRFSIEAVHTPDNKYRGQFGFHGFRVDFTGSGIPVNRAQNGIFNPSTPQRGTHQSSGGRRQARPVK